MRISKLAFLNVAMVIVIVFIAQPVVQAGQGLTIWPIENVRGDSSTGSLTIYYQVAGWDSDTSEELVLMIFILRLYERKTRTWHFISASAESTFSLLQDANGPNAPQQQELLKFFNGPVLAELNPGYASVHLTGVENDFENLTDNKPPYAVGADITLVAR
jgi:hypothetical protein